MNQATRDTANIARSTLITIRASLFDLPNPLLFDAIGIIKTLIEGEDRPIPLAIDIDFELTDKGSVAVLENAPSGGLAFEIIFKNKLLWRLGSWCRGGRRATGDGAARGDPAGLRRSTLSTRS